MMASGEHTVEYRVPMPRAPIPPCHPGYRPSTLSMPSSEFEDHSSQLTPRQKEIILQRRRAWKQSKIATEEEIDHLNVVLKPVDDRVKKAINACVSTESAETRRELEVSRYMRSEIMLQLHVQHRQLEDVNEALMDLSHVVESSGEDDDAMDPVEYFDPVSWEAVE